MSVTEPLVANFGSCRHAKSLLHSNFTKTCKHDKPIINKKNINFKIFLQPLIFVSQPIKLLHKWDHAAESVYGEQRCKSTTGGLETNWSLLESAKQQPNLYLESWTDEKMQERCVNLPVRSKDTQPTVKITLLWYDKSSTCLNQHCMPTRAHVIKRWSCNPQIQLWIPHKNIIFSVFSFAFCKDFLN